MCVIPKSSLRRICQRYLLNSTHRPDKCEIRRFYFNKMVGQLLQKQVTYGCDISVHLPVRVELYKLWSDTRFIEVELFADTLSETGFFQFCDTSNLQVGFGGISRWTMDMDMGLKSVCLTPADSKKLNVQIINCFEENFCKEEPYRRSALLPLEGASGVHWFVQDGVFEALPF